MSKLTLEAKAARRGEQSEMIRTLNRLVKIVGFLIVPIGGVLFYQHYYVLQESLRISVTSTVAAILDMIPEGLYLLASVALAVRVMRLAKEKVLVHDMKCIGTLARVDVLCVDKTGTITEPDMEVIDTIPLTQKPEELNVLLGHFAACMSSDNATMAALKTHYPSPQTVTADRVTSFSSVHKYSSATFDGTCYVLGALEFVLRDDYGAYQEQVDIYAAQGFRTLLFAHYRGVADDSTLTEPVTPLALVLLTNPIRSAAAETFRYFSQQDVQIKVISGDNPITVSQVAAQAGIPNAERYVYAVLLREETDYLQAVSQYTVFGRVTPEQKRELVRALKKTGHTVAMTGDGVNDILAMKEADCSIAMASGSDATAQASQLVLLDSDFSCMPSVVLEGRRVVNNIQRSASLFLVKNIFSLLMALFTIRAMITYPLEPSQISLISMFTIGTPAFLLALETNTSRIQGAFLPNVFRKALPAGLTDFIVVSALVIFCDTFGVEQTDVSTASALILVVVGFLIL